MGRSHDSHMTCGRDHVTFVMMSSVNIVQVTALCLSGGHKGEFVCLFVCVYPWRCVARETSTTEEKLTSGAVELFSMHFSW